MKKAVALPWSLETDSRHTPDEMNAQLYSHEVRVNLLSVLRRTKLLRLLETLGTAHGISSSSRIGSRSDKVAMIPNMIAMSL